MTNYERDEAALWYYERPDPEPPDYDPSDQYDLDEGWRPVPNTEFIPPHPVEVEQDDADPGY